MTRSAILGLAAAVGAASIAGCARGGSLVVEGATLIDGTGGPAVGGARVVVVDERVTCVGGPADCPAPSGADVLDASGFWIVPGLIDTDIGPDDAPDAPARAQLRFLLGVTTAGERPALTGADLIIRAERGDPVPRHILSAPSTGGSVLLEGESLLLEGGSLPLEEGPAPADTLAERLASELEAAGTALEPRLLARELDVAPYRLPVGLNPLLELPLFVEAIRTSLPDRSAEEQAAAETRLEDARRFARAFHEAGGTLVTGSGGVLAPGLAIHEEMRALVAAGLEPEEALAAATRDAAAALGVDDRGTIEPGKLGDFLILEGDPRLDIANAQLVSRVVKGGVLHDPVVVFESLLDEPGSRASAGRTRVMIGFGASLVAVLLLVWVAVRHRRSIPPGWRA